MCIHIMSNIFLEFYNEFKIDITIQYGIIQYALCDYTIYQVYHMILKLHTYKLFPVGTRPSMSNIVYRSSPSYYIMLKSFGILVINSSQNVGDL